MSPRTPGHRDNCLNTSPLAEHLETIRALCRQHGVARLDVFGSICTADFNAERSDIDFLVEYPPGHDLGPWLRDLYVLQEALRALLGHDIDLVLSDALRNRWFRQEADKTRMTIYDASPSSEVA